MEDQAFMLTVQKRRKSQRVFLPAKLSLTMALRAKHSLGCQMALILQIQATTGTMTQIIKSSTTKSL